MSNYCVLKPMAPNMRGKRVTSNTWTASLTYEDKIMTLNRNLGLFAAIITTLGTTQTAAQARQYDDLPAPNAIAQGTPISASSPTTTAPAGKPILTKNHFFTGTVPGSQSTATLYGPGQTTGTTASTAQVSASGKPSLTSLPAVQTTVFTPVAGANKIAFSDTSPAVPFHGLVEQKGSDSGQAKNAVNSNQATQATQVYDPRR